MTDARILFAGTPDFALPTLEALVRNGYHVVGVLTQPDKPAKHNKLTPPPVKVAAMAFGLPVLQFDKVRRQGVEAIRALAPDLIVTVAYGQIISQEIIDIPRCGVINVHGSLLPRLRGASPIQQCILDGDTRTGITIMRTALAVDSGDIVLQRAIDIGEKETAGELFDRMAVLGAYTLLEVLPAILDGTATYTPQDHSQATFCRMIGKQDGHIDWTRPYRQLDCHVRGMNPWPSAFCTLEGKLFKIWQISLVQQAVLAPVGSVYRAGAKEGIVVQCADALVRLDVVQPEGGRRMQDTEYMVGHTLPVGTLLQ